MNYDLLVIGSGPGGYVAAIRAAQLGLKTAIAEKCPELGGTCLNVGCIPSKTLLDASELYHQLHSKGAKIGIETTGLSANWQTMLARKDEVIATTCSGVEYLMKKNKITVHWGTAKFVSAHEVSITSDAQERSTVENITAKNIIIATGSAPAELPNISADGQKILTSTHALSLPEIPKSMTIIGGGVIGLELGSVFARLGSQITVVEYLDHIAGAMDKDLSKQLQRSLKGLGFTFLLGREVLDAKPTAEGLSLKLRKKGEKSEESGASEELSSECCLLSVGRKPYTQGLGLESAGVRVDERGFILVDHNCKTSVDHIYAIGDVIGGAMLAHKAEEEGVFVAESIEGQKPALNHHLIPSVIYTWPEVASVGATEEQLKQAGIEYKRGSFPIQALGRARASDDTEGLVKILARASDDEVLGVHIVAARAADLIAEAVVAMEYKASAEDIARICHAHPTYSEALKEAALAATDNRALHI